MGDFENKKDELAGKAKEAVGDATNNEELENEGKADQVTSGAKQKLSDAVDGIKDKANEVIGSFKDKEK
ncbi:CsbD family protein [Corynebacterium flavescens]|uniref:CsbD family protein n=1 Tax=Corynebacterium flavescens TaxID=28028 RepID=UPI00257D1BBA|nr:MULTISPECIES: CsbD family protein [Corynebacterium]MDN6199933.1 CsbD family protein [Corynebacterium flavescens]MDN6226213.1 CsbD family protein [Corynebacterium flavescens]MDN6236744.1 CsbD family protein [Corynebacterium flavescens]MDN6460083.1 CsbD family protein [Corynebacterium flavescens]MDN6552827.1 CsbD family protein [Corynebacterium flavescens]